MSEANESKFDVSVSRWLHRVRQQNQLNPRQGKSHVANHVIIIAVTSYFQIVKIIRVSLDQNKTQFEYFGLLPDQIGDVILSGAKPGLNTEWRHRAEPEESRTSGAC